MIQCTREALIVALQSQLSESRFQHCLRVEQTGLKLAEQNGIDLEKTSIACLLHDYAKELPKEALLPFRENKAYRRDWEHWGNAIWHGPLAAFLAEKEFGLQDAEVFWAIFNHTVGSREWTPVAKVVAISDYIEPGRTFNGVDEAREIAKNSLDLAISYKLTHELQYLIQNHRLIYPETIAVYNAWYSKTNQKGECL